MSICRSTIADLGLLESADVLGLLDSVDLLGLRNSADLLRLVDGTDLRLLDSAGCFTGDRDWAQLRLRSI